MAGKNYSFKKLIVYFSTILFLPGCQSPVREVNQLEKQRKIHQSMLTIDTHSDTPLNIVRRGQNLSIRGDSRKGGGKIDFPRMKEGGLDGIFFAVYVGQGPRTPEGNEKAKQTALTIFDSIHAVINRYPDLVQQGLTADDLKKINKNGRLAIFIGIENGYVIGTDIGMLKTYYDLGARYITLCHTRNNDICDSSTDPDGPEHNGLSGFGKEVVREMNKLGMMIDVSHISDKAFYDVLEMSKAPVIASHSGARALCDHPRDLDDKMLRALADKNGVIQVCTVSEYLKKLPPYPERDSAQQAVTSKYGNFYQLPPDKQEIFLHAWFAVDSLFPPRLATVSDFVDHIDHIVQVAGIDHVGIGTDFDGGGELEDCYDVTEMENITFELLKRGYSKENIQKIWSGNLLRVFREVERAKE
jgi:membrane dipeptidase